MALNENTNICELGLVGHPFQNDTLAKWEPNDGSGRYRGVHVWALVPLALFEVTKHDYRRLKWEFIKKVFADDGEWMMEVLAYKPLYVDKDENIVFQVEAVIGAE